MAKVLTSDDCTLAAQEQFSRAVQSRKWMAAVFYVENGKLCVEKTTCDFPVSEFTPSVLQLKRLLDKELGLVEVEESGPLPVARYLRGSYEDQGSAGINESATREKEVITKDDVGEVPMEFFGDDEIRVGD